MNTPYYPSLCQVNTRVWLNEPGNGATLDGISDSELDKLKEAGYDWVWFMSVWQTGEAGRIISRSNQGWRKEFEETLPDLKDEDIGGSGFAVKCYRTSAALGGDEALARLRSRVNDRGMKLMLDFVPNHTGIDHEWVEENPGFFIRGTENDLARFPDNYFRVRVGENELIFAHGRDPYFPGWPDTLQLDYGNPDLQEAMSRELIRIAGQCDGVRCDMAMLLLPEVFERTWGIRSRPFWPEAIKKVKESYPGFRLMAEVYWDLEWTMLQQGFDYAYDKRLYDRLKEGQPRPVREHFFAGLEYQGKMARFIENHDEQRAAREFIPGKHEAAALLTFLSPGLRFFHQGQGEGRKFKVSPHLVRGRSEQPNPQLSKFYTTLTGLLKYPVFRTGSWQLLTCTQAWEGNRTHDKYICFSWHGQDGEKYLVITNYSSGRSQCFLKLPFDDLRGSEWVLLDKIAGTIFAREGNELTERGLYLDEPGWTVYVFEMQPRS
jgi:glycosidase